MSTDGRVSIFRLLNPTPHLPPSHTEQWQFRTICLVCTTSTPKPHIWEYPLLLPPSFPPISSGMMTEPSCHETADFPHNPNMTLCLPQAAPFVTPGGGQEEQGTVTTSGSPTLDAVPVLSLPGSKQLTKVLEHSLPSFSMNKHQG